MRLHASFRNVGDHAGDDGAQGARSGGRRCGAADPEPFPLHEGKTPGRSAETVWGKE